MVIFILKLVDVETESENWIFLMYRNTETPYAIPIYKVLLCLVIATYNYEATNAFLVLGEVGIPYIYSLIIFTVDTV